MGYQYQDPGIHRLTCDRDELERNLSLIGAELDQYNRNLRNLASALDEVVSGRESSDAHGDVFTQLSRINPETQLLLQTRLDFGAVGKGKQATVGLSGSGYGSTGKSRMAIASYGKRATNGHLVHSTASRDAQKRIGEKGVGEPPTPLPPLDRCIWCVYSATTVHPNQYKS